MLAPLLVGRPGLAELLLIAAVLVVPIVVFGFIVSIARRARRHRGEPDETVPPDGSDR